MSWPLVLAALGAWSGSAMFVYVAPYVTSDDLGGIPFSQLTPAGLLTIIILLIASGRLVPRRTMEDAIRDKNEWRAAHRISEQARAEQGEVMKELLDHARTSDAFIRSVSQAASRQYPGPPGSGYLGPGGE